MIVCGLDLATRSGIAMLDGTRLVHGEAFRPRGDNDAEIFHGFRVHFRSLLVAFNVKHVAAEQPLPTNIQVADKKADERSGTAGAMRNPVTMATYLRIYGIFAHASEVCYALNIPFDVVHQATWRKAFLGNGRADKDMAVAQCRLLGLNLKSKDLAEAVGVAWWLNGMLAQPRLGELDLAGKAA